MAAPPIPPIRLGLIGTGLAVEKLHWPASRGLTDRYVVTAFTDSAAEQSGRFADYSGVDPARATAFLTLAAGHPDRHIAQIRLLCGDIARVHGAVRTANSTIDAPSDPTLDLVFTGGAIGNHTASYPEIPVPPEPNDVRLYGTEGVLTGRVAQSVANAMVVQRALDSAERAAELALDPVPGAGPVPLWRPRGSTGLFDGLPGQRISSSASFAA